MSTSGRGFLLRYPTAEGRGQESMPGTQKDRRPLPLSGAHTCSTSPFPVMAPSLAREGRALGASPPPNCSSSQHGCREDSIPNTQALGAIQTVASCANSLIRIGAPCAFRPTYPDKWSAALCRLPAQPPRPALLPQHEPLPRCSASSAPWGCFLPSRR